MKKNVMKFILWAVTFIMAFTIHNLFENILIAPAFFALHAGICSVILVALLLLFAFGKETALQQFGGLLIIDLRFGVALIITASFSYLATLLVEVDFYVAYFLITFGHAMFNVDYFDSIDFNCDKLKSKLSKMCKNDGKLKLLGNTTISKKAGSATNDIKGKFFNPSKTVGTAKNTEATEKRSEPAIQYETTENPIIPEYEVILERKPEIHSSINPASFDLEVPGDDFISES